MYIVMVHYDCDVDGSTWYRAFTGTLDQINSFLVEQMIAGQRNYTTVKVKWIWKDGVMNQFI